MLGEKIWKRKAKVVCVEYKIFLEILDEEGLKDLPDIAKALLFTQMIARK